MNPTEQMKRQQQYKTYVDQKVLIRGTFLEGLTLAIRN